MKEIQLTLTVNEANVVLQALGNLPFVQVYPIIQKLQDQASLQLNSELETPTAAPSETPAAEVEEPALA